MRSKQGKCLIRVAKMGRHDVITRASIQKTNHAKKRTVCLCQIPNCVENSVLLRVVTHTSVWEVTRKSLCERYK